MFSVIVTSSLRHHAPTFKPIVSTFYPYETRQIENSDGLSGPLIPTSPFKNPDRVIGSCIPAVRGSLHHPFKNRTESDVRGSLHPSLKILTDLAVRG